MSHWNYRLIRTPQGTFVYSVYYDETGAPASCSALPASPHGATLEALRADFTLFERALSEPVLEFAAFRSAANHDAAPVLSGDDALVLYALATRISDTPSEVPLLRGEEQALCALQAALQRLLSAPLTREYGALLSAARERLASTFPGTNA